MSAPRRAPRRRVDGVLFLDKPTGVSSNHALQAVRRLLNAEKAGHSGTLDPMATGLLPLCFGEATKFSGELLHADKRYLATVRLGTETDSGDADGKVIATTDASQISAASVTDVLARFTGGIEQVPPMYSALKRDGRPLYEYARRGIELERPARLVTVFNLVLVNWRGREFDLDVHCSKGTYVRTLAIDIGRALGVGAHLSALRRMAIGEMAIEGAVPLSYLESLSRDELDGLLAPPDALIAQLPAVCLDESAARRIIHGQSVHLMTGTGDCGRRRIYDMAGRFMGTGTLEPDAVLSPERLLAFQKPVPLNG